MSSYQTPLLTRYGSVLMRYIWSEQHSRLLWRKLWVLLAKAQTNYGFVSFEEYKDLKIHQKDLDLSLSKKYEQELKHDLAAEIKVFGGQAKIGKRIIHLGATSEDIKSNAESIQLLESSRNIKYKLSRLLCDFAGFILRTKDIPTIGFTHLQAALPTTLGYRFSLYAQDLEMDLQELSKFRHKTKGFRGAVGTAASYSALGMPEYWDGEIFHEFGLKLFEVTGQTSPRKQEFQLLSILTGIGQTLSKFAYDIRLLMSPMSGELTYLSASEQVGSSAMPFKKNPIEAENICSLARMLKGHLMTAWDNASLSFLERTLDDSASRRIILPESFLLVDEIISKSATVLRKLHLNENASYDLFTKHSKDAVQEKLLIEAVMNGADRQKEHERLMKKGVGKYWKSFQMSSYTGYASQKAERFANRVLRQHKNFLKKPS